MFQIALLDKASIPEVGSSRKMTYELPTKDIAKDSFLFDPPDNAETKQFYSSINSVTSNISSNSELCIYTPLIENINCKCSKTVKSSYRQSFYVHNPRLNLILSKSRSKSLPYILTIPLVFEIIPVNNEIIVVFPAPLWPKRQNIWPSYRFSVMLLTAT